MRTLLFIAALAIAVSSVAGQAQFHVNNGNECVPAKIGDCVPVTVDGVQSYVQPYRFEKGILKSYRASDSSCSTISHSDFNSALPCSRLAPGEAAPSTFNALHVSSAHPLSLVTIGDDHSGAAYMNVTNGVVVGSLTYFFFHTSAGNVRLIEQYDDGSYLTNAGLCQIGASCNLNGMTVRMETISFDSLSLLPRPLAHVASYFTGGVSPEAVTTDFVYVEFDSGFAVGSSNENAFYLREDGFIVSASALETVLTGVPPLVEITDMQLKNADQPRPSLVSKVSHSDFETYISTPCLQTTADFSFLDNGNSPSPRYVADCEFSFSFSFSLSSFFSFSFLPMEEAEEPLAFEETPAFTLFG